MTESFPPLVGAATPESSRHRYARRHAPDRPDDFRYPAERDRDRILYSPAFRRLAGVTQIASATATQLYHNRLTHSLKVAQIGRRLAERLLRSGKSKEIQRQVDPDVVETACLAHDLGHPPFGHIAEDELDRLVRAQGLEGFEANAQAFRILTKLEVRRRDVPGLNLSRATLNAVLKYPWLREGQHARDPKWGAFISEAEDFQFATNGVPPGKPSPESVLMDWADDVSYALHDLEDFYQAGLIPLELLFNGRAEIEGFIPRAAHRLADKTRATPGDLVEAFRDLTPLLQMFSAPYKGTARDRTSIHSFTSALITRYVESVTFSSGTVHIKEAPRLEVAMLKELTWHYVIDNPGLATVQHGQRHVIRGMFDLFMDWSSHPNEQARLPVALKEALTSVRSDAEASGSFYENDTVLRARAVADYIAGLTDDQAAVMFQRLAGFTLTSAGEGWYRRGL